MSDAQERCMNLPPESAGLQRLKKWAALLRAENNSLGHTLETYAMEWEEDLARANKADPSPEEREAARALLAAVDAELDETWGCNSYHPSLLPAVERMRAALAVPHTPVVQPGWKLVPVEPTRAMLGAAFDAQGEATTSATRAIYCAMLASAPSAPVVAEQPADAPKQDQE